MKTSKFITAMNQALNLASLRSGGEFKYNEIELMDEHATLKAEYQELKKQGLI